jgi:AcrR family transcriptional regulator
MNNAQPKGRRLSSQLSQARAAAAAADIIAEDGIEALSMRVLAARLGCSVGTLTYHFESKQDLLEQVFTQYTVGTPEFFDNVLYGEDWVDDVMARVRKLLPLYPERDTQWRVHLAYWAYSLPSGPEESNVVHKVLRSCHKVCASLFEKGQMSGNVDRRYSAIDLGVQFTQIIQGTIFGMLHEPVSTREDLVAPIRAYLEQLQPRH